MASNSSKPIAAVAEISSTQRNRLRTQGNPRKPSEKGMQGSHHTAALSRSFSTGSQLSNSGSKRSRTTSEEEMGILLQMEPNPRFHNALERNESRIRDLEKQIVELSELMASRRGKKSRNQKKSIDRSDANVKDKKKTDTCIHSPSTL